MAADAMNDAWDTAVDTYEHGSKAVADKINEVRPVSATTDELRAKVDAARERMDQLRETLAGMAPTADAADVEAKVEPVAEEPAPEAPAEEPAAEEPGTEE
jgi:hypothetical protein